MFLIASLLGASACVGEVDEADEQSSEALIGGDDDSPGDEANPTGDPNVAIDPSRDAVAACPFGALCFWDQPYFGNPIYTARGFGCQNIPFFMNNKASSWYNRAFIPATLYNGPNCTGFHVEAPALLANPNMTGPLNNQVTSYCRGFNCP